MLRIEGRTPGDESATYRIKFGGSFSPLSSKTRDGAQSAPKISNSDDTRVRVNSVGTIIPVPVVPAGTATNQKSDKTTNAKPETSEKAGDIDAAKTDQAVKPEITISEKPESSDSSKTTVADSKNAEKTTTSAKSVPKSAAKTPVKRPVRPSTGTRVSKKPGTSPKPTAKPEKAPDPMEGIQLVILLKNGKALEYKMTEVVRFTVDKGFLIVLGKDGNVSRYSMIDVAKVTLQ